ncbi:MAG: YlxR family protein [Coriobacteriales bacterium]|nr:YlxR family protein [Coriobacteriales bacterium]
MATRRRKTPMRRCVVCGMTGEKTSLVRFVRMADGSVELDPTGRVPGRGAYLCGEDGCLEKAFAGGKLERALRTHMTQDDRRRLNDAYKAFASGQGSPSDGKVERGSSDAVEGIQ